MKILITRPEPEATQLATLLLQDDIEARVLPLLHIRFLNQNPAHQTLTPSDALIFVSKNAVSAYPHPPIENACFAVGKSTAKLLTEKGFDCVLYPTDGEGSEALLALPELQVVKGRHFTIVCGVEGREVLEKTLIDRGALVSHLITYQTHFRPIEEKDLTLLHEHYDLIITTSTHGLGYLAKIADQHAPDLKRRPVTVLAGNMLQSALTLGFECPLLVRTFQNQDLHEFIRHPESNFNPCQ